MACEDIVCSSETREFPMMLGCFVYDGNKTSLEKRRNITGFGGRRMSYRITGETVTASFLVKCDADMDVFKWWYEEELDGGVNDFNIRHPSIGDKTRVAKFSDPPSIEKTGNAYVIKVNMVFTDVDDGTIVCNFCEGA